MESPANGPLPAAKLVQTAWGRRIRKARLRADLSQAQLADRVLVRQNTISRIETGVAAPSDALKIRLCVALGRDMDDLFAWPEGIIDIARFRGDAA